MYEEQTYLIALANKIQAEQGLIECGVILAKLGRINPEYHSDEIMAEVNKAHDDILERQKELREIIYTSDRIMNAIKSTTN